MTILTNYSPMITSADVHVNSLIALNILRVIALLFSGLVFVFALIKMYKMYKISNNKSKIIVVSNAETSVSVSNQKVNVSEKKVASIFQNIPFRILCIALSRSILNFVLLISMIFSSHENDLRIIVIISWAIGQMLFWLQQSMLIYRFIATNIQSKMMRKSSQNIPILQKVKMFYIIAYILTGIAQLVFVSIAFIKDREKELMLFVTWGVLCSVLTAGHISCAVYALSRTNMLINDSMKSNSSNTTTDNTYKSLISLMKKNNDLIRILWIISIPVTLIFFLPAIIPQLLILHDYIIMGLSFVSSVILLSGLRLIK